MREMFCRRTTLHVLKYHLLQSCHQATDVQRLQSVDIRFYAPKQRRSMPTTQRGYTDWISVDVVDDPSSTPCFASLCYEYFQLTQAHPSTMHRANMQAATYVRHYRRRVRSHAAG